MVPKLLIFFFFFWCMHVCVFSIFIYFLFFSTRQVTLLVLKHGLIGGAACGGITVSAFTFVCLHSNVVDIIPVSTVSTSMYCSGMYIGIKIPTFHTGLNTGHTSHSGQFRALSASTGRTKQYKKIVFFFVIF